MINCGNILGNIEFNCENQITTGTVIVYISNYNDVSGVVKNEERLITSMSFASCLYKIEGRQNSVAPNYSLIKGSFTELYDHVVKCLGFDISPETKLNLEGAKSGRFVVIVENVYKGYGGKNAFEVYGLNAGLEMTILTRDSNNNDTQGAFDLTFATNKNKEPFMPLYFQTDGSYQSTKLFLENALICGQPKDFNNDFNNDFN